MAINRERLLEAAQKFVEKKKYAAAVGELRKLVDADPNDVRTLQRIGDLQVKQGLFAESVDTFEAVGNLYAKGGFAQKAIAVFKHVGEIIRTSAPEIEARYGHIGPKLADLHHEIGLTNDAIAILEQVAARLQQQQREGDLNAVLQKIAQFDPSNPMAQLRLAEALSRARDTEGAVAAFVTAASILVQADRRDDAIHVLERLLHHKALPDQARVCAQLYLGRNRPGDATLGLTKLQICFQANPRDLDTLALVAQAFDVLGQPGRAIEVQKQMAGIAREEGRMDVFREIVVFLARVAPDDVAVRQLAQGLDA